MDTMKESTKSEEGDYQLDRSYLNQSFLRMKSHILDKVFRKTVEQIWFAFDYNGDGVIDFEEAKVLV